MKIRHLLILWIFVLALCPPPTAVARTPIAIFSHNDYQRNVPFYQAYAQGVFSIEADVFLDNGKLLVGHDKSDLRPDNTLQALYIEPAVAQFRRHGGKPYAEKGKPLQLLIELKSATDPTLRAVIAELERYPEVFDFERNPQAIRIVITGQVPSAEDFDKYPEYIRFDGNPQITYTPEQLQRIAMMSTSFRNLSIWNGKGTLIRHEQQRVERLIAEVHALGKPIRFWEAPDGVTTWYTFYNFGVDYLNTDYVERCTELFSDFTNKNFEIAANRDTDHHDDKGVTRTKKLDKTTRNFKGFENEKLQLSDNIATYTPTYRNDGKPRPIKNVIFLIGDGMGLSQISAAESANRNLTLMQMKHIGLQRSAAKDAYTTDSAAAGSALATGEKCYNRHISMTPDSCQIPSLTDFFTARGVRCGVVTLGNVADATPAAFYGHNVERDDADALTAELLDGKLTVLCGSGIDVFEKRNDNLDLIAQLKKQYQFVRSIDRIGQQPVICIDERMGDAAEEANLTLLAEATRKTIQNLTKEGGNGFFLMVEGAKIDYAGHSKCLPGSILETLSFDLAITEAMRFADSNGETLVVVTADHETGGLTLLDGDIRTGHVMGYYVTDDHTPSMLPVFAYGPRADLFCGVYDNTEIAKRIKTAVTD